MARVPARGNRFQVSITLSVSLEGWRDLMKRSMATSMWPACLAAVGGTLIAPLFIPLIYGDAYTAAARPFQIVIWMIPVAWFSGHFRFSLIAAGHQRREFAVSAASAVVTVTSAVVLGHYRGSVGAASALLTGGIVNAVLAISASNRHIGVVQIVPSIGLALLATAISPGRGCRRDGRRRRARRDDHRVPDVRRDSGAAG